MLCHHFLNLEVFGSIHFHYTFLLFVAFLRTERAGSNISCNSSGVILADLLLRKMLIGSWIISPPAFRRAERAGTNFPGNSSGVILIGFDTPNICFFGS